MLLFLNVCNGQLRPDKYDTSYVSGYIVSVNIGYKYSSIKPIIKMQVYVDKQLPCSTVYVWNGASKDSLGIDNKGMYWSESEKYDSTQNYGPCGFNGMASAYWSTYKGDTVISYDCESSTYGLYKELYFIPNKNKKHKLGKSYELKEFDYYGEIDTWIKPTIIIGCG